MGNFDFNIYDGLSFSELLKEIHGNQKKKDKKIQILIDQLKPLIKEMGDAITIVPLIKEYLDVSVKNDEHLIKMAQIVQRLSGKDSSDDSMLSQEERDNLLKLAENEFKNIEDGDSQTDSNK